MAWTGFTDDQLKHIKYETDDVLEEGNPNSNPPRKPAQRGRGGAQRGRGQHGRGAASRNRTAAQRASGPRPPKEQHTETLSPNQMLSRPTDIPNRTRPEQRPQLESSGRVKDKDNSEHIARRARGNESGGPKTMNVQSSQEKGDSLRKQPVDPGVNGKDGLVESLQEDEVENKEVVTEEIGEKEGLSRELTKMQKFQEEQKKMEEDNARRRTLLTKAIADRKRKTQAESKRLTYIQKEMGKIECLLTTDVRILRDRIEEASRDYLEAQKRYKKAEAEFVEAKIYLHKIEDMKEALTEHLFTIIHENELRKSKKLEELVLKLDIDNIDEFEKQIAEENAAAKSPTHTNTPDRVGPNTTVITTAPLANENDPSVVIATSIETDVKSNEETSSDGKVSYDDIPPSSKSEKSVTSEVKIATSDKQESEQTNSMRDNYPDGVPSSKTDLKQTGSVQTNETAEQLQSKTGLDSTQKTEGDSNSVASVNEPPIAS